MQWTEKPPCRKAFSSQSASVVLSSARRMRMRIPRDDSTSIAVARKPHLPADESHLKGSERDNAAQTGYQNDSGENHEGARQRRCVRGSLAHRVRAGRKMRCRLHLRLTGGLIDVARAMRVLKRYNISQPRVSMTREGSREVATVRGTLSDSRRSIGLAAALSRIPGGLEAVVSRDDDSLAALEEA